mgnify:CR=1 FL=1
MKSFAKYITEGENTKPFAHAENPSNGYFSEAIIQKINAMMGKIIEEDQQDGSLATEEADENDMHLLSCEETISYA